MQQRRVELAGILRLAVQEGIEGLQIAFGGHGFRSYSAAERRMASDLRLRFAQFGQDLQRLRRFLLVDAAHGEADMDEHPVADASLDGMLPHRRCRRY